MTTAWRHDLTDATADRQVPTLSVGVLRESAAGERRVALALDGVTRLRALGLQPLTDPDLVRALAGAGVTEISLDGLPRTVSSARRPWTRSPQLRHRRRPVRRPDRRGSGSVREVTVDDADLQLAYATKVVIVPGLRTRRSPGTARTGRAGPGPQRPPCRCQLRHAPRRRTDARAHKRAAGRGQRPYTQLKDLDEITPVFASTDVMLVVGANDVTNPAAGRAGNAVSGMPILDVDKAKSVIVIKRSLGHGFAGIGNELYTNSMTAMLFGDAKAELSALLTGLHAYVG